MAVKQTGNSLREEKVLGGYLRNWNKKQQVPVQHPRGFHGCETDRKFSARRKGAGRVLAELEWRYIESERFDEGVIQSPCEE